MMGQQIVVGDNMPDGNVRNYAHVARMGVPADEAVYNLHKSLASLLATLAQRQLPAIRVPEVCAGLRCAAGPGAESWE